MAHPKIWFILSEGKVTGPFDQEEIESNLSSAKDPQIWGRGQSEWMTPSRWRQVLNEMIHIVPHKSSTPGLWKVRVEGQEKKPMVYSDLILFLKSLRDLSHVDISPGDGPVKWKEIYAYTEITEDLGVSRRAHPRVPIVGTLNCHSDEGDFTCKVISISEGGLGVNDAKSLKIGQQLKTTLNSTNLFIPINSTCEVVYVGNDGYAGLRFVGLPPEFKSSIVEYVNKFATS